MKIYLQLCFEEGDPFEAGAVLHLAGGQAIELTHAAPSKMLDLSAFDRDADGQLSGVDDPATHGEPPAPADVGTVVPVSEAVSLADVINPNGPGPAL